MSLPVHFAPLQGYTDQVYRRVHAKVFGGIDTYYTPFIRFEKEGFRSKDLKDIEPEENVAIPVVPQLIAATPDEFRSIATLFIEKGYRRADINLGCPFPMQVRLHRGAGMLPYSDEIACLLDTIYEFPQLAFSLKMRLGWDCKTDAFRLLPLLKEYPLTHITLHPRIGTQQYKGDVDSDCFSLFYETCPVPLFYNGDLYSLIDFHSMTERFPRLAGLMSGRGLLAKPWLAMEYSSGHPLSAGEVKERLREFHRLLQDGYSIRLEGGEHQVLSKMKTIWDYLLPDAEKKLRKKVVKSSSLQVYNRAVSDLLDSL